MKTAPRCLIARIFLLAALPIFAPGSPASNGDGVVLQSVSAVRTGVLVSERVGTAKTPRIRATLTIDPIVTGVSQNGRGERVLVGALPVVGSLATLSLVKPGDVNQDGAVTPEDALEALQCYLTGGCRTPDKTAAADICPGAGDPFVTPRDAQAIFELFLGLSPACE